MTSQIQVFRKHPHNVALVLSMCSHAWGVKQAMHRGQADASVHLSGGAESGQLFEDPYEMKTSEECPVSQLINSKEDCAAAAAAIWGKLVTAADIREISMNSYAAGCFKYQPPGSTVGRFYLNSIMNEDPSGWASDSGRCTEDPGYATCVCRLYPVTSTTTTPPPIPLGNGYCRVMTPSGPEKHEDWTTYKKCIDFASCRNECRKGCAGIAWTATPADVNYDDCYESGLPRCVVYLGKEPATTYATDMAQNQDYACYEGPGGEAIPTGAALGNGYCRVMTPSGVEKHENWTTYKKCIDLTSCRGECHEGCAGIAWTATPASANYDECYTSGLPRCVVYQGKEPATTYLENMDPSQDYTCYRGPGGEAIPNGADLGNGYCRVMTESGPKKHEDWTTYKKCIDLASCKNECHEGCAGIAWTATPAENNYDDCYKSGLPRCVVYIGMVPAKTSETNMAPGQDYTCYRGPGGAASSTMGGGAAISTK
jgi:hypothetical protein